MGGFYLAVLVALQTAPATITGVVRDADTMAPLAGAVVSLPDLERGVVTGPDGRYALPGVPPGPQHLAVHLVGYAERSLHAIVPRGGTLEIDVALRPEPLRLDAVEVRVPVVVRGLEGEGDAYPDRVSSMAAVRNHPLLAEPDAFIALGGGEVALDPEMPSGVHVLGGAADQTAYVLDGIPIFNPFHTAGVTSAWNPDALSRLGLTTRADVHALGGAIEGVTRAPDAAYRVRGSVSTTQARVAMSGPVAGDAGYVAGLRTGLHRLVSPRDEASYLGGGTGDWLGAVEAGALGGRLRLLAYGNDDEVEATPSPASLSGGERHTFTWFSRSFGASWHRPVAGGDVRIAAWRATADVGATWFTAAGGDRLEARRRDWGVRAAATRGDARSRSGLALAFERIRTTHRVAADSGAGPWRLDARTPIVTARLRHERDAAKGVRLDGGVSLAVTPDAVRTGAHGEARWRAGERLTLTARAVRAHQFTQSLRNPESVVGAIFPVDVAVAADDRVPIARARTLALAAAHRPAPGVRFALQVWTRATDGLVLVAPRAGGPFATAGFATGRGSARGLSAELAFRSARVGVLASYGLQRVRLTHADTTWTPPYGATHRFEGGVIVFPTATTSVRLGVAGAAGRRATAARGDLEWESCNLLDRGCEFIGSPDHADEPLGGTTLPGYLRVDLGARTHWHLAPGGHDVRIALFATVSNVLGRRNVLTYAVDPATGARTGIEMRPAAPFVIGLDGRF